MQHRNRMRLKLQQWFAAVVLGSAAVLAFAVFFILSLWILAGAAVMLLTVLFFALLFRIKPRR